MMINQIKVNFGRKTSANKSSSAHVSRVLYNRNAFNASIAWLKYDCSSVSTADPPRPAASMTTPELFYPNHDHPLTQPLITMMFWAAKIYNSFWECSAIQVIKTNLWANWLLPNSKKPINPKEIKLGRERQIKFLLTCIRGVVWIL